MTAYPFKVGHPFVGKRWVDGLPNPGASEAERMARAILNERRIPNAIPDCDWETLCVWLDGDLLQPLPGELYWTPPPLFPGPLSGPNHPLDEVRSAIGALCACTCARRLASGQFRIGWSAYPHLLLPAGDARSAYWTRASYRPMGSGRAGVFTRYLAVTGRAVGFYQGRLSPLSRRDKRHAIDGLLRCARLRVLAFLDKELAS